MRAAIWVIVTIGAVLLALYVVNLGLNASKSVSLAAAVRPEVPAVEPRTAVIEGPSYKQDIQPIFNYYCVDCHGPSRAENGLRLDSYEGTVFGTAYGKVIVPGSSVTSTLVSVINGGAHPSIAMPYGSSKLTVNRIKNIIYWIDAGARSG